MLGYLLETLLRSSLGKVVVATSDGPADDGIAGLAGRMGVDCVRGSEADVASRFEDAVLRFGFDAFVRVCGDSPLMDPELIRCGIGEFQSGGYDLATNTQPRSFPKGQSVEVIRSGMFLAARPSFTSPEDREHVTRYFYRNADRFRIVNFGSGGDWGGSQLSVDTPEDFLRFESLVASVDRPHWEYRWSDWVGILSRSAHGGGGTA